MNFQRARGLRVDGVVEWITRAMGLAGTGGSYDSAPTTANGVVRVGSYLNVRSRCIVLVTELQVHYLLDKELISTSREAIGTEFPLGMIGYTLHIFK